MMFADDKVGSIEHGDSIGRDDTCFEYVVNTV